ncbi:MAG: hemolysin family protein [Aquabacterium sp.]|uniref:hemolysin family protein n=1 Tax=Aquabacterium sp. TaxID=1872578 RepID=UPI0027166A9C|nr:hemolysin family protein [Aquabacterium sp.]MDO9004950.1 hemolysin family protein [Aquabacterium sp.]
MEFWILLLLILLSGFFAMSEMSIGASRIAILTQMAEAGNEGARIAAALRSQPSRLLAATQTGLTALATLLGVFGEAMWVPRIETFIETEIAWLAFAKYPLALLLVVGSITFATIVIGEIIPKRIALARPEAIAALLAPAMAMFAKLNRPFIWALSVASERLLALFPFKESAAHVASDEIRAMITAGRRDGGLDGTSGELLGNVFRLDDRKVASVMTPANGIIFLDLQAPSEINLEKIKTQSVSRFLVCKGGLSQVMGYIESRELLQHLLAGNQLDLGKLPTHAIQFIPNTQSLIGVLEFFRKQKTHLAIVVNEFGQTEGLVTLSDLLSSVVGDVPSSVDELPLAVQREDGSWLLDGLLPLDEMKDKLGITSLPEEDLGNYHTVGGFVITAVGRIPKKAETFDWHGWRFEVVDMDKNRVDEVFARPIGTAIPND